MAHKLRTTGLNRGFFWSPDWLWVYSNQTANVFWYGTPILCSLAEMYLNTPDLALLNSLFVCLNFPSYGEELFVLSDFGRSVL